MLFFRILQAKRLHWLNGKLGDQKVPNAFVASRGDEKGFAVPVHSQTRQDSGSGRLAAINLAASMALGSQLAERCFPEQGR